MFRQKDRRTLNKSKDMFRIMTVAVLFCATVLLFLFQLFVLQIQKGEYYAEKAAPKEYRKQVLEISRGQIYDRNGVLLVSNKKQYNVIVDKSTLDSKDYNGALYSFVEFCNSHNVTLEDTLPLEKEYPHVLDEDYVFDDQKVKNFDKFCKNNELNRSDFKKDPSSLYIYLCDRYNIPEEDRNSKDTFSVVGIRYGMDYSDFEYISKYTLIEDIDEEFRTLLSESLFNMHGIAIDTTDERYYNMGSLASHILGRTGPIYKDEAQEFVVDKGYNYSDIIGKEGAERAFEDYLHGFNGVELVEFDENNNVIGKTTQTEAKNGYSVRLTIDSGMQSVSEKALEEEIKTASSIGLGDFIPNNGEDCKAGCVVVMNPNNGDVLASASYPNFDLNTYSEDYNVLRLNEGKPYLNRATMGTYPPGSTFKIVTSIAALLTGTATEEELVYDRGVFSKYADRGYAPHCWVYDNTGGTHEYVNMKTAIEKSCNYYFYEIGDRLGIENLSHYAALLGLGSKTGIEVPEYTGTIAGPKTAVNNVWNPGDTLQAAIGQSNNAFTPIQLCSYMCTVVNGGTRYKATLLNEVVDTYTGETVKVNEPVVLDELNLPPHLVETLKEAMKSVVVEGTARNVFDNYEYEVGGKTGTAQLGKGSDTVLFLGFAPYENPEIVVCVVVENGDVSARASGVAKQIFDYYFESLEQESAKEENVQSDE